MNKTSTIIVFIKIKKSFGFNLINEKCFKNEGFYKGQYIILQIYTLK